MGILDQILGGLTGNNAGGSSGLENVLTSMIGGGQQTTSGQSSTGSTGGLGGLLSQFENAGLGNLVQSWIGNGPNQSVSPQQLQDVFGHSQVQDMASQAGMQPHDFLSQLSQHLPNAVNNATPAGKLPDEGTMSV